MYFDPQTATYEVIGTVQGIGYDCRTDNVSKFEDSTDGIWNKVSFWVNWIRGKLAEYDEPSCIPGYKKLAF